MPRCPAHSDALDLATQLRRSTGTFLVPAMPRGTSSTASRLLIGRLEIRSGAPPPIADLLVVLINIVLVDMQSEIGGRKTAHCREHLKRRDAHIALRSEQVHLGTEILELIVQQIGYESQAEVVLARRSLDSDPGRLLLCLIRGDFALRGSIVMPSDKSGLLGLPPLRFQFEPTLAHEVLGCAHLRVNDAVVERHAHDPEYGGGVRIDRS